MAGRWRVAQRGWSVLVYSVSITCSGLACADNDSEEAGCLSDAGCDDDSPYEDGCHYDCFGYIECRDGAVTIWDHTPVDCAYWTGECPHSTYVCENGCRFEPSRVPYHWQWDYSVERLLCLNPPKLPGDECWGDGDCLPTEGVVELDGTVTNAHLRCDYELGVCVQGDAPVVDTFLQTCTGFHPSYVPSGAIADGYAGTCEEYSGVCLVARKDASDCTRQGCSLPCIGDWECPANSICDGNLVDYDGAGYSDYQGGACRPWPLQPLADLLICSPVDWPY